MYVVGLTGGIASGKTAVSDHFAKLGATVIDTDLIAREVVAKGTPGLREIQSAFGDDVIQSDGTLNRKALRGIVFNDTHQLALLESITHPLIRDNVAKAIANAKGPYTILVVPLLVEKNWLEFVDRVLVVDVDSDAQKQRLMDRDASNAEEADAILAAQASREDRLTAAHDIIENTGSMASLLAAVDALHAQYLVLARSSS